MMLSDGEILEAVSRGEIKILPFNSDNIGPCSVDLTLSDEFVVFKGSKLIDPKDRGTLVKNTEIVKTGNNPFILKPQQFVLASTREKLALSKGYAATLEGRSSIARLGIVVHAAGLVNPGTGMLRPKPLILEVYCQNTAPVKLYPGMRIVQVIFHRLSRPASVGYDERPQSTYSISNEWLRLKL